MANDGQDSGAAPAVERAESVIMLPLGGKNPLTATNAYVITGSKHVLVDPGPEGGAGELLQQLSRHRISLGDIGLIVITHGHPDHFGCAAQLKEWTQAPVAVHELDAEYIHWGSVPAVNPVTKLGGLARSFFKTKCPSVEPDILLREGDKLGRYAGRGRVILTPGHTAGSISIILPDGNCIVGDLLMRGLRARTPSSPWFAEDMREVKESLQKVVSAGARTLLVGHGGPFKVEELPRRCPWIQLTSESVAPESEEGEERPHRSRPRRRRPPRREGQSDTRQNGSSGESGAVQ
ncbi:MAG: MBL fold metallo-hydrolase [Dehalococcoidia bacterium]|nr:MBL fold metallo-hydrolase [Dehalococcoidia bacterium]